MCECEANDAVDVNADKLIDMEEGEALRSL